VASNCRRPQFGGDSHQIDLLMPAESGDERAVAATPEPRQAGDGLCRRVCASQPRPAKPASIIAQVEGSGTAFKSSMLIEPLPLFTPAFTGLCFDLGRSAL
jgi:hypothetical protein